MSMVEVIIRLGLAGVLAGYLFYRHWQRMRQSPEWAEPKDWDGKSFDASGIAPRIERVRKDYLREKHPPVSHFHHRLLAFARNAVSHLAFFQDRPHNEGRNPGA